MVELRGNPRLGIDDVTIDERDIEALRAIADHGSMNQAANALGRSYARIQQRITELEESVGPLVSRHRGGKGGGGSSLTDAAVDMIAEFERLQAEFAGLSRAEVSTIEGTVVDRNGPIATVDTDAGHLRAIVTTDAETVTVHVRSDAIILQSPTERGPAPDTSLRNHIQGTISAIDATEGIVTITVESGDSTELLTNVTETSLDRLGLDVGDPVVASFKATATHSIPRPPDRELTPGE